MLGFIPVCNWFLLWACFQRAQHDLARRQNYWDYCLMFWPSHLGSENIFCFLYIFPNYGYLLSAYCVSFGLQVDLWALFLSTFGAFQIRSLPPQIGVVSGILLDWHSLQCAEFQIMKKLYSLFNVSMFMLLFVMLWPIVVSYCTFVMRL